MKSNVLSLVLLCTASCVADTAVPDSVDLGVDMQRQEASQWCWAAAAQSLANWSGMNVSQSEVVSATFGRECTPATCNGANNPIAFLTEVAGLHVAGFAYSMSTPDFWRRELAAGVPIIAYMTNEQTIGADGGTVGLTANHFVVIDGYSPAGFIVLDPADPVPQAFTWNELQDYGPLHMHVKPASAGYVVAD